MVTPGPADKLIPPYQLWGRGKTNVYVPSVAQEVLTFLALIGVWLAVVCFAIDTCPYSLNNGLPAG
jgi:hypothetical protein